MPVIIGLENMRSVLFSLVFVIGALSCAGPCLAENSRPSLEYQVKASLIFNFLQFIEWPPEVWEQSPTTMHICLIGGDRFGIALTTLEQEIVRGKHIEISHFEASEDSRLKDCQVVFISDGSPTDIDRILSLVRNQSILTVGESSDFLEKGGIISFLIDSDRVVFDINRRAALQARLNVSSKLLRVARMVKD